MSTKTKKEENDKGGLVVKKKRGRPRKDSKKLTQDAKKIEKLFDTNGQLIKNEDLESRILTSVQLNLENSDSKAKEDNPAKLKEKINNQIGQLEEKLNIIDTEF